MKLTTYAICDIGRVRADNQDNLYLNGVLRESFSDTSTFRHSDTSDNVGVYAVADGMGGASHGGLASFIAVNEMKKTNFPNKKDAMSRYLLERNSDICHIMKKNNGVRMGSTFAGLYVAEDSAVVTNIGDSRIYLLRGGELRQLSVDHTAARTKVELGIITEEEARKDPERNKLTQHLGIFPSEMEIEPYREQVTLCDGDVFLLCSDGLTDMLDNDLILHILNTYNSLEEKAEVLLAEALKNGGRDNITIMLVNARAGGKFAKRRGLFAKKPALYAGVASLLIFIVVFGVVLTGMLRNGRGAASQDIGYGQNSDSQRIDNSEDAHETWIPQETPEPTPESTHSSTLEPTSEPTLEPTLELSPESTPEQTPEPTQTPTSAPTPSPALHQIRYAPVANVVEINRDIARSILEGRGFYVTEEEYFNNEVEDGFVISQIPGSGTEHPVGGRVTIIVSRGHAPQELPAYTPTPTQTLPSPPIEPVVTPEPPTTPSPPPSPEPPSDDIENGDNNVNNNENDNENDEYNSSAADPTVNYTANPEDDEEELPE
ncbi:MAG: protein phosphatase 2C domain-containing protein [Defluviitaleaceae bacterium]|nr:protein phosphatase 2C domain-containing protein [Defluviitaleaceae bacterium]